MAEIPELEAYKKGRYVLLAFKKDIGPVLSEASNYSDDIILGKTAKISQRQIVDHKSKFEGIFYESSVTDSVPPAVVTFDSVNIKMLPLCSSIFCIIAIGS